MDDYLTKPFSPKELMVRARNLITRYALRKAWWQQEKEAEAKKPDILVPNEKEASKVIYKADVEWLKAVKSIIEQELANNQFRITDLAEAFNLSQRQFQRKINALTGISPKQYQLEIALQMARELLENKVYTNVTAISFSIGISNPSRFSDMYEKRFGKRPTEYFKTYVEAD